MPRTEKSHTNEGKELGREKWARIYVDDGRDSHEAVDLLRAKGYFVQTLRVIGNFSPRLLLGRHTLDGLWEIKRFLEREG